VFVGCWVGVLGVGVGGLGFGVWGLGVWGLGFDAVLVASRICADRCNLWLGVRNQSPSSPFSIRPTMACLPFTVRPGTHHQPSAKLKSIPILCVLCASVVSSPSKIAPTSEIMKQAAATQPYFAKASAAPIPEKSSTRK